MDELEKLDDVFRSLDQYLTDKNNESQVQEIKVKAKYIEELLQELIQHIDRIFDDHN